jgi:hypothetical protein
MRRPRFRQVLAASVIAGFVIVAIGAWVTAAGHRAVGVRLGVFGVVVVLWSFLYYWRERRR